MSRPSTSRSRSTADAIPYRFVPGGNLVTVLDNDGPTSTDTTPPVVAKHRNVIVERGGSRPAWVFFSPPSATDDVDGTVTVDLCPRIDVGDADWSDEGVVLGHRLGRQHRPAARST